MGVFILTFLVFPGAMDNTYYNFMQKNAIGISWFFLLNSTFFSVFDTVGRKLGGLVNLEPTTISVLAALRIVFLATFLLIAFEVKPTWLFGSDWFKMANIVVFSFTNGLVATLCAIKAPQCVPEGN